jgi:hypothetical protein
MYLNKFGAISDEKDLSATEQKKKKQAWIPRENVDQERQKSAFSKKSQRASFAFGKQRDGYCRSIGLL